MKGSKFRKIIATILCVSLVLTNVSVHYSDGMPIIHDVESNVISYAEENDEYNGSKKVKNIIIDEDDVIINPYKKYLNATISILGVEPGPLPVVSDVEFNMSGVVQVESNAPFYIPDNVYEFIKTKPVGATGGSGLPNNSYIITFDFGIPDWYEEQIPPILASFSEPVTFPTVDPSKVNYGFEFLYWERDFWKIGSGETVGGESVKNGFHCNDDMLTVFMPKLYAKDVYNVTYDIDDCYSSKKINNTYVNYDGTHVFPKIDNIDIKGARHKSWYCEEYNIRVDANGSFTFNDSTLGYTMAGVGNVVNVCFKAEFEDTEVKLNFEKCAPVGAKSEIVGTSSSIVVPTRTITKKEKGLFTLDGFKLEGWSREENGKIVLYDIDDVYAADFIKEGEQDVTLYSVFMASNITEEKKEERKDNGGSGGGGSPIYGKNGEILAPGAVKIDKLNDYIKSGTFEFDPLSNNFKFFTYNTIGEKQYVVNDWFCIVNQITNKSNWYITDAYGNVLIGWVWYDGDGENKGLYYFSKDNANYATMVTGTHIIDGIEYKFNENGKYVSGLDILPKSYQFVTKNNINTNTNINTNVNINTNAKANININNDIQSQDADMYAFNTTYEEEKSDERVLLGGPILTLTDMILTYKNPDGTNLYSTAISSKDLIKDDKGHAFGVTRLDYKPPALADKRFCGWEYRYTNSDGLPDAAIFNSGIRIGLVTDTVLHAVYEDMEYEITYRDVHGEVDNLLCIEAAIKYNYLSGNNNYRVCTPSSLPNILKYKFLGFSTTPKDTVAQYKPGDYINVNDDMTLYTVWEKIPIPLISELKICIEREYKVAEQKLKDAGYDILGDLKKGAGCYAVCLGYKTTTDPNLAIKDIKLKRDYLGRLPSEKDKWFDVEYDLVKCLDGSSKSNINTGSAAISGYLYTTTDNTRGNGIENMWLRDGDLDLYEAIAAGYSYVSTSLDMNDANLNSGINKATPLYLLFQQDKPVLSMIVDPYYPKEKLTPTDWMLKVPSKYLVSEFNIPGTHDSGTAKIKHMRPYHAQTQDKTITQQLECGVRVFDGRFGYDDGSNVFYHGGEVVPEITDFGTFWEHIFYQVIDDLFLAYACYDTTYQTVMSDKKLTVNAALRYMINFLLAHPTETIIFRLRFEVYNEEDYRDEMKDVLKEYAKTGMLYLDEKIPTLREARGKIVIIDGGWSNSNRNLGQGIKYGDTDTQYYEEIDTCDVDGDEKIPELEAYLERQKGTMIKNIPEFDNVRYPIFKFVNFNCYGNGLVPYPNHHAPTVNKWFINEAVLYDGNYYGMMNFDFVTHEMAKKVYMSNFE